MSFLSKLKSGLSKTSSKISGGLKQVFLMKKLDEETLETLEETLISCDMGPQVAAKIVAEFSKTKFGKEVAEDEIKKSLSFEIAKILSPHTKKIDITSAKPFVILMVGVNGNGKTTTIGKLASQFKAEKKKVAIAACDTFRAAAVEQLKVWADRTSSVFISGAENSDPASVAFKAYEQAVKEKIDVLLIDTAGRLQNKTELMDELAKINRVLTKQNENIPHETIIVLDSTTGQNAYSQVEAFKNYVKLSGLIITKLDGTAKAGVVVGLADKFKLPIFAIGIGEGVDDLKDFSAEDFANNLVGL
jgi:fused signal recognition particle receptor